MLQAKQVFQNMLHVRYNDGYIYSVRMLEMTQTKLNLYFYAKCAQQDSSNLHNMIVATNHTTQPNVLDNSLLQKTQESQQSTSEV